MKIKVDELKIYYVLEDVDINIELDDALTETVERFGYMRQASRNIGADYATGIRDLAFNKKEK